MNALSTLFSIAARLVLAVASLVLFLVVLAAGLVIFGGVLLWSLIRGRRPTLQRKFEQLRQSGAILLIGTDSGVPLNFHSDSTWREIDTWVNVFGVPAMDALRAATFWPAVAMKVEKEVGTVSPGKKADVIAVRGDVLRHVDLLQDVDVVIKGGVRYK